MSGPYRCLRYTARAKHLILSVRRRRRRSSVRWRRELEAAHDELDPRHLLVAVVVRLLLVRPHLDAPARLLLGDPGRPEQLLTPAAPAIDQPNIEEDVLPRGAPLGVTAERIKKNARPRTYDRNGSLSYLLSCLLVFPCLPACLFLDC